MCSHLSTVLREADQVDAWIARFAAINDLGNTLTVLQDLLLRLWGRHRVVYHLEGVEVKTFRCSLPCQTAGIISDEVRAPDQGCCSPQRPLHQARKRWNRRAWFKTSGKISLVLIDLDGLPKSIVWPSSPFLNQSTGGPKVKAVM